MTPKKKRQVSKGTGKRFTSQKPKPQAAPVRRTPLPPSPAERALRKHISTFGLGSRFKAEFEQAFEQYMGPGSIRRDGDRKILMLEEDGPNFLGFQEWFYFDYRLPEGDHIIDRFATEIGPQLSAAQRHILGDWLATNRLRLLETQSVEPGVGETMQDLLSGEILHLNDISFSYQGLRWSILLGRPLLTEGHWHFTGSGSLLTPLEKPRILKAAQELWQAYQGAHPQASFLDFYRDHSLDLIKAANQIIDWRNNPETLLTPEGHPLISARAEFGLRGDPQAVESALDETEEFVFVNLEEQGEFKDCLHYVWLLRGRSFVPKADREPAAPGGLMLSNFWTAGPGEPDYPTLGDLILCEEDLTLLCTSRERLEAGKGLLAEILGGKIRHRQDRFEALEAGLDEPDLEDEEEFDWEEIRSPNEFPDPARAAEAVQVDEELRERFTLRWLDTPDQNGRTPRQAAQTPEGRAELVEQLKAVEFLQDQALRAGKKPPMRLDMIREELGL